MGLGLGLVIGLEVPPPPPTPPPPPPSQPQPPPPIAGAFGANTGLQDAHNLCWKLGAVHRRHAGRALLRSYDAERRPVAVANAELAVRNYHRG